MLSKRANSIGSFYLFLLYVSVMLIITLLQQEFVLLPELQSFDLVGDETKALILEKWQKWRWASFLIAPLLLLFRLCLVSLCLFVGSFFTSDMAGRKFKDWWKVGLIAQAIMLLYSVVICVINISVGSDETILFTKYTSLLFLVNDEIEQWLKIPLSAVNIFEIIYWGVMARLVCTKTNNGYSKSFGFVMSSYGVGYLFYIVFLMFLILYLN